MAPGYTKKADKALSKLDRQYATRIKKRLAKVVSQGDPRKPPQKMKLLENPEEIWSYRVDKYRAICKIHGGKQRVDVLDVGHRKGIYKRMERGLGGIRE